MQKKKDQSCQKATEVEDASNSDMEVSYQDEDLDLSEPENLILASVQYVIIRYEGNYYPGNNEGIYHIFLLLF